MAALAATLVVGVKVGGAQRWLPVPGLTELGIRVQPAELVKWATLMAVAVLLAGSGRRSSARERGDRRLQPVPAAMALALQPIGLLLLQPDFGSAALLALLVGLLLFAAGARLRQLAALGATGILPLKSQIPKYHKTVSSK